MCLGVDPHGPQLPLIGTGRRNRDGKGFSSVGLCSRVAEVAFPRAVAFWFYALAFLAGILFYLIWGLSYGSWNLLRPELVGAYAVTIVLVGFGVAGMLPYRKEARRL